MATLFESIIAGDVPGRFVWADDQCVAFATIEPTSPGHVLVVPRCPYPKWTDAPAPVAAHLASVAQAIGAAQEDAFGVPRAGMAIAGFDVPHLHLHVIPLRDHTDILLSKGAPASPAELDEAVAVLRAALVSRGNGANVPADPSSAALG